MVKSISHTVTRPGRRAGDPSVDIPVPADLATVPGIPQRSVDVAFYSREHPLESQAVYKSADRQWAVIHQSSDIDEFRKGHDERMEPMYQEGLVSGDVEPTGSSGLRGGLNGGHPASRPGTRIRRSRLRETRPSLHILW